MSKLIKITAEDCVLTVMAPPERGTFYRLPVYMKGCGINFIITDVLHKGV